MSREEPGRFERLAHLFDAALDVPQDQRDEFVRAQAGGDAALAAEALALLRADDEAGATDPLAPLPHVDAAIGRRLGPWRIERLLGEGGMGRVYVASRADRAFEMRSAIKLLRGSIDLERLRRFQRERQALARLDHPGIARLLDGGATEDGNGTDGTPWLAMELVDGEPIDAFCDRRRLPLDARLALVEEVCAAVDHAHRRLLIHRDLKPSNILVDGDGRARLVDFGIARLLEAEAGDPALTAPGERVLTPRYASPEQVKGEDAGAASDVYSLGIVLHELLSGSSPYRLESGSRYAQERATCEADPIAPSQAFASCPAAVRESIAAARATTPAKLERALKSDLDQVVLRCLQKDPERRYASAHELSADLSRHRRGLPVIARGDALGYRAARFVRRNPVATAASALLVVALLLALGAQIAAARRDAGRLAVILPLADLKRARDLGREAQALWPMRPEIAPQLEDWLARARELLARRSLHESGRASLASLDLTADERGWLADALDQVLAEFDRLGAADPFGDTLAGVTARLESARALRPASVEAHADEWRAAIESVRANPRYHGLAIAPQLGLAPLGNDPRSGLAEFWHVQSGERPRRGADGRIVPSETDAIVLVLLPGGEATHGAQSADPAAPRYDPDARSDEGPPRRVTIAPFFAGKFEVMQAQWAQITNQVPSGYPPGATFGRQVVGRDHPVEQVSHDDATTALRRVDLELPTEEQWEYACRAGAETRFSTGDDGASLAGSANLADRFARENDGASSWLYSDSIDDGATVHAAVGSYAPNAFGLHDMHGNVWELCAGAIAGGGNKDRVARGGGFFNPPAMLRASARYPVTRDFRSHNLGLRAARRLER